MKEPDRIVRMLRSMATIFLAVVVTVTGLFGQELNLSTRSKKAQKLYHQAEQHANKRNPELAIDALTQALEIDENFIEGWLLLAEMWQEGQHPDKALAAFQRAFSIDSLKYPQMYFSMGSLAYDVADYRLAAKYYKNYQTLNQLDSIQKSVVSKSLNIALVASGLELEPSDVIIKNTGRIMNTTSDEFVNFLTADDQMMVITRKTRRDTLIEGKEMYAEGFFVAHHTDTSWSQPQAMQLPWADGYNAGGMSMSVDGRSMLFTGCYWPDSKGSCDIYYSNRIGHTWQTPVAFNSRINTTGWESQPVISADGTTLYFTSKRGGGKGGADIWKSNYIPEKGWGTPVNLGDSINTAGDEMAPFIHGDGQTLYFSSNGHPGLGGYDMFFVKKDEAGRWTGVRNMGVPINTSYDEVNLFVNLMGTHGWISSNREGGMGGMDIWDFPIPKTVAPQSIALLAGIVVDKLTGKPLEAEVEILTLPAVIEQINLKTDPLTGEFLVVLNPKNNYIFHISKTGYLFYSEQIVIENTSKEPHIDKVYALQPVKSGVSMNLNNIFFNFNSDKLLPPSKPELDRLVNFLMDNPAIGVLVTGHTDSIGSASFNLELSGKRAKSVVAYLLNHGIESERITSQGVGDTKPLATNQNEQGRAMNRRTEITIKDIF